MRLLSTAVALALALTACGGDDEPAPAPTAAASATASSAAILRARTLAPLVNLVPTDLTGFNAASPVEDDPLPAEAVTKAATCLGLSDAEVTQFLGEQVDDSEVESQDFSQGALPSLGFSSTLDVSEDGGVDGPSFTRFFPLVFSEKGAACLGQLLTSASQASLPDGGEVELLDTAVLKVPTQPGQQAGGLRVRIKTTVQGQQVGLEFDYAAVYEKDVAVTLVGTATATAVRETAFLDLAGTLGKRLAANV